MSNIEMYGQYYRGKDLIIDTNLWLLLLVGGFDKKMITSFKRTRIFTEADYDTILSFSKNFNIVVTPNITTEISNLTENWNKSKNSKFFSYWKSIINSMNETYLHTEKAMGSCFLKLGLTDSAIYEIAKNGCIVITVDFDLYSFLISNNVLALNYNHFRV